MRVCLRVTGIILVWVWVVLVLMVYLPALVQRGVISITLPAFLEEVVMGPSPPSPSPTPPLSPSPSLSPPPLPSPTPDRRLTWRKGCPSCDHAADVSRDDKECDLLGFHFPSSFAGVSACESEDRFGDGGSGGGGGGGGEVVVDAEMMMWCSNFRETSCFLEAKNIEVDYQTIEGGLITITSEEDAKGGARSIGEGTFGVHCPPKKEALYRAPVQLHSIINNIQQLPQSHSCKATLNHTVYFVQRQHPFNLYHHMYDFFDIFNTIVKRDIDINDLQIIFLDKLPDGFFAGIWQEAFSPNHKIGHIDDLKNMYDGKICYKHAFFDPNGVPDPVPWVRTFFESDLVCESSVYINYFTNVIVAGMGLEKVLPPAGMITITYCKRSHQSSAYSYRKIGRYIENEHEVISTIQSVADEHQVQLNVVDFSEVPVKEQLRIVRSTDILIGPHGAGLSWTLFMHPGTALIELHVSDLNGAAQCFTSYAKLAGVHHKTLTATTTEGDYRVMTYKDNHLAVVKGTLASFIKQKKEKG